MGDRELTYKDIQALNGQDAVAALFTMLGYETSVRVEQSPVALGITADSLVTQIRHVELIANQEDLLYVYLFELASVTLTATRAIARAFRSRAGNYLLVLADDYDHLDFVLLEKSLPLPAVAGGLSQKQVSIRPRSLSVSRRNPDRIHLRVLRRFAYTEPDPIAQYQKLCSAYTVAEWSEDFFNNRALFSDYFLKERLPAEYAEWREDPRPVFQGFQGLYTQPSARWSGKTRSELQGELLEPAFRLLGYTATPRNGQREEKSEADYRLFAHDGRALLALCLTYPWNRSLDGKDDRDPDRSEENPAAAVVSLLQRDGIDWALVTNGKLWRLYSAKTHSRATNYYEIDLEEVMAEGGTVADDPSTAFRYFWLFFRRQALEPPTPLLNRILEGSEQYAKALGERLKDRVFEEIFPHFAEGFIEWMRRAEGHDSDLPQERLDQIFQGTLTFLYRLLFLLYAESRDLLPVKETRGYWEKSVIRLKSEVAEAAGNIDGEAEIKLKAGYRTDSATLYDRLSSLFRIIDQGEATINVPVYNGGLFLTTPDPEDASHEAEIARFLLAYKIPDRHLALGLDRLTRDVDEKTQALVFIDYKSLGVRQLGSIYEGLLEFKLRVANQKMAVVKGKRTEEILPYKEAVSKKLKILSEGREKGAKERIYAKGKIYLENDRRERKATGSYYTPDHVVRYIVRYTVGPILEEKFESLRLRLREAQKLYREAIRAKTEFERRRMTPPDPEQRALTALQEKFQSNLVDEFFDLHILDPAMGSGHFLVEAVDFITDRILDFLNAFPWNPILAQLKHTRETILREIDEQGVSIDQSRLTDVNLLKRHVLKRCIYGVDLNPMAVELAKVSLWLDCFTLGAPLSFLDHHLRCGNSLLGVTVEQVDRIRAAKGQLLLSASSDWQGLLQAVQGMILVGGLPDVTASQVAQSRTTYKSALSKLEHFKKILDIHAARWFSRTTTNQRNGKKNKPTQDYLFDEIIRSGDLFEWAHGRKAPMLESDPYCRVLLACSKVARGRSLFHWELEFPEIFYGPRPGTKQVIDRLEGAGFDVVIGNPPYDVLATEELGYDVSQDLAFYEAAPVYDHAIRGKKNLYKLFICRGTSVMSATGTLSFIVPMPLLGDDQAAGVRRMLLKNTGLTAIEVFPQKDDPHNRIFPEAKLATTVFITRARPTGMHFTVRTHRARFIEDVSPVLRVVPEEIIRFDPTNSPIPSCTQRDWDIAVRLTTHEKSKRLGYYCRAWQGEINETTDGKRGFISTNLADGPRILRGSNVSLYVLREASQGEAIFLRKQKYLRGKPDSAKARHHKQRRLGWQESSPQNNFRRIIAAAIPSGEFCNHKINYISEGDSQLSLDFVLALLNSKISDWFFRLGSTNAAVSHYQIYNLPAPHITSYGVSQNWKALFDKAQWAELAELLYSTCAEPGTIPNFVADALAEMSRRIQEIEAKRILKSRSERSRLALESQPIQDAADAVLFRCYGLSDDEARYVNQRLEEML